MEPVVGVEEGKLHGREAEDYKGKTFYAFQGIPYAKPPVGELRFKAPQPPEEWNGIRDATKEGDICYSKDLMLNFSGSENCLTLNIYTRDFRRNTEPMPVMFWIHGGAFAYGSGNSETFGPEFLITENVVLVTINYRLGFLGFLAMKDAKLGVPGNAGFKDMVMALKWVQKNIGNFGGDPGNVTIFGESAGGAAAHLLMLSPLAKGLFHRVICQSGMGTNPWVRAAYVVKDLSKTLGFVSENEEEILYFLRTMTYQKIVEAQEELAIEYSLALHGLTIEDGSGDDELFLTEEPELIIRKGNYHHVPLITGYCSLECLFYKKYTEKHGRQPSPLNIERLIPTSLNFKLGTREIQDTANKIKEFYYGEEDINDDNEMNEILVQSDTMFFFDIIVNTKAHALSSTQPVYLYRFNMDGKLNIMKRELNITSPGTTHGDDLGYMFKSIITPEYINPCSPEAVMLWKMVRMWTNFARTGNPNLVGEDSGVTWKPVDKNKINFLNIDYNLTAGVNPDNERLAFWEGLAAAAIAEGK